MAQPDANSYRCRPSRRRGGTKTLLARLRMGQLWLWLAAVSVGASIGGCGGGDMKRTASVAQTASSSSPAGLASTLDRDKDNDNPSRSYYDDDDGFVLHYGAAMSAAEERQVASTVMRYYRAAASGDGATACSLLYSSIAESLPEEHVEGRRSSGGQGSPGSQETTCAAVLARAFRQQHHKLAVQARGLRVSGARVESEWGWAILSSAGTHAPSRILMLREGALWKVGELMAIEMP